MIPISLCIITKNEADKLQRCLESVKEYPFEIIVVDTGSADDSVAVAKSYTEHVYHYDWISDFSAARNFSISKASNDWIFILDTDEYVTSIDLDDVYRTIAEYPQRIGMIFRTSKGNDGYDTSEEVNMAKSKRNLDILFASEQEFPDYYTYYQIGQTYFPCMTTKMHLSIMKSL